MNSLVTIEEYDKSYQAQVAVLALEQAGIHCYLQDETIVAMDWFIASAVGGIKLQVSMDDADQARNILAEIRNSQRDREQQNQDQWVALRCGRCKKPVAFSGESFGRVENCPKCGKFVDVPDTSDPTLGVDLIEKTIGEAKGQADSSYQGIGNRKYLLGEIFLVLCIAYFRDLYLAVSTYLSFFWMEVNEGDQLLTESASGQYEYGYDALWRRSLFVIICMVPILLLNGLKRNERVLSAVRIGEGLLVGVGLGLVAFSFYWLIWSWQVVPEWENAHEPPWSNEGSVVAWFAVLFPALIANSIAEELVMRAYLIDRLERLLGSCWAAVLISAMMFGSYHIYQGVLGGFSASLMGLCFGFYFALCRRLFPLVVGHTVGSLLCILVF